MNSAGRRPPRTLTQTDIRCPSQVLRKVGIPHVAHTPTLPCHEYTWGINTQKVRVMEIPFRWKERPLLRSRIHVSWKELYPCHLKTPQKRNIEAVLQFLEKKNVLGRTFPPLFFIWAADRERDRSPTALAEGRALFSFSFRATIHRTLMGFLGFWVSRLVII